MDDPRGEVSFIPARASSASWKVLGAALVSHLVDGPDFKGSLAISLLTCKMLCGRHKMKYPSIFFLLLFFLLGMERGDKSSVKVVCSLSKHREKALGIHCSGAG